MVRALKLIVFIVVAAIMIPPRPGAAENPFTATAWVCAAQTRTNEPPKPPIRFVINGKELRKQTSHDDSVMRDFDSVLKDYSGVSVFQIVMNDQHAVIAAAATGAKQRDGSTWAVGQMIVIDKSTGKYDETLVVPNVDSGLVLETGACIAD
jgi:hypothetical protein